MLVAPVAVEYVALGQAAHMIAPIIEYVPTAHSVHNTEPDVRFDFPAVQLMHGPLSGPVHPALHVQTASPNVILSEPTPHALQGPPLTPVKPTLQMQSVAILLAKGEAVLGGQLLHVVAPVSVKTFPAAQSVHGSEPDEALYFPAAHLTHGPPLAPVRPCLQLHLVTLELATGELVWEGQLLHVFDSDAPTAVENVSAAQAVQAAEPELSLNLPALHLTHGPP